ncbi:MAG TPA: polyphenol oxidase family protein [Actinomycetota bacterium]|nr:polyphenol oxidase family protein [Actinomycetota bacterium]
MRVVVPPVPGVVFTTASCGNLSRAGGNDAAVATGNRRAVSEALGISPAWLTVRQVHGRGVLCAGEPPGASPEADAIVVRTPGRPVAVLAADCVPIALAGSDAAGQATAGAVHAGWRGLCRGVIEATAAAADPGPDSRLSAWIGPCIGPCCFEVGPEVPEAFAAGRPGAPDCCERVGARLHFDLRKAAAWVLGEAGVNVGGWEVPCTCCDDRFFSYRRDGTAQRQALVVWNQG